MKIKWSCKGRKEGIEGGRVRKYEIWYKQGQRKIEVKRGRRRNREVTLSYERQENEDRIEGEVKNDKRKDSKGQCINNSLI